MNFIAQIKKITVKNCVDMSKTSRLELETDAPIASMLEHVQADQLVRVTVEVVQ